MTTLALLKAIKKAGSERALAKELGIKPQSVNNWKRGERKMSIRNALKIEHLYSDDPDINKEQLRPDFEW